ncbi:MAG TPA: TolC family protein [Gemmataceae bacterium]|nr:TolC family protein [Gemmataceae bacterium]
MNTIKQSCARFGLVLLGASAVAWSVSPGQEPAQCGPSPTSWNAVQPAVAPSPFAAAPELSPEALVTEVLARNPTLTEMTAAAQAAAARYPQAISLEDPMFGATFGPGTIAPDDRGVEFASRLEISQKYPWPGKRRLRGENAAADARAADLDVDDARLQLIENARDAFADYYLAGRGLAVNQEALDILRSIQSNQETLFKTGKIPEPDLLQTGVQIGRERQRRLTLERMLDVARARINALLDLPPDSPLPPPAPIPSAAALPDEQALRAAALTQRPDLKALAERIAAEQAALGLAHKEYYPDFEPFFMYDRFMGNVSDNRDLAAMLGVRVNLPIRLARRDAAVQEAEARVNQRVAELRRLTDDVNLAVDQAYKETVESEKMVRLYEESILPDVELNVKSSQTSYTTGKIPAVTLLDAERNLIDLRDSYYQATADAFRRRAALERAVGGSRDGVTPSPAPPSAPPAPPSPPAHLPPVSPGS